MNYFVIVPIRKFDIGIINWLNTYVSQQGGHWHAEIDIWERRVVLFSRSEDKDNFKKHFNL